MEYLYFKKINFKLIFVHSSQQILSHPAIEAENTEIEQGGKGQKDKKATGKQKPLSGDKVSNITDVNC